MVIIVLELLLGGGKPKATQPPPQNPLFLYDPEQNVDLAGMNPTISKRSGTTVSTSILIDGHPTINLSTTAHGIVFTFPTPFDFNQSDWTIEWSSRVATFGSGYNNEIFFSNAAFTSWLGARWADSGYDNKIQVGIGAWSDNSALWRGPRKVDVAGKVKHYAIICKDGQVRFYIDGQQQTMMNGTGSTGATTTYFNKPAGLPVYNTLYIGWMNSINVAYAGNVGRIRLSGYARYVGASYDVEPF